MAWRRDRGEDLLPRCAGEASHSPGGGRDENLSVHLSTETGQLHTENVCRTVDGRVAVRDTEHFIVARNQLEHTSEQGGSALVDVRYENSNASIYRSSRHGVISDNRMVIAAGQNITHAIFLVGSHDLVVAQNDIFNDSDNITRIRLTGQVHDDAERGYGRIVIRDNHVYGGAIDAAGSAVFQDDWVIFGPNSLDGAGRFDTLLKSVADLPGSSVYLGGIKNVRSGSPSIAQVRGSVADAVPLRTWHGELGGQRVTDLTFGSGFRTMTLSDSEGFVTVGVRVNLSRPVTESITLELTQDGGSKHSLSITPALGDGQYVMLDAEGLELSRKQFRRGAQIGARIVDQSGAESGLVVEAEVVGVHMNAFADS